MLSIDAIQAKRDLYSSIDGEEVSKLASLCHAAADLAADVSKGALAFGSAHVVTYNPVTASTADCARVL